MRLDFQKMSMLTSIDVRHQFIVSYSCSWGIYRVWSNAISYGTMTMFSSRLLTSSVNSLTSLIPGHL